MKSEEMMQVVNHELPKVFHSDMQYGCHGCHLEETSSDIIFFVAAWPVGTKFHLYIEEKFLFLGCQFQLLCNLKVLSTYKVCHCSSIFFDSTKT